VAFLYGTDFWVGLAFVVFILIALRFGVHRTIAGSLDQRSALIKTELDEARRLREEAEKVLAEYKRKQQEAEAEARAIVEQAGAEAQQIAADAKTRMEEFVARRTKMAEAKIAQAETQALADVRAAAADAAVRAAELIVAETAKGKDGEALLENAIRDVKARLA
jgi:F-type H+-transporting ATPase subunit b